MPKIYKKTFSIDGYKVPYRKKKNGVYEARRQIDKIKIEASSKSLETLREKIKTELNNLRVTRAAPKINRAVKFTAYFETWLETVKRPHIKQDTYDDYLRNYNVHIRPALDGLKVTEVRQFDCQKIINALRAEGKVRTAKKVYLLLRGVFKYACGDGLIAFSPAANIILGVYEADEGVPLTRGEEKRLVEDFLKNPLISAQAFVFLCYTGLRRSELASVVIDGAWVRVVCAKQRKGRKEKRRAVPISPMLARFLPMIDVERIKQLDINELTRRFHKLYPDHHLHELRHTFTTRAKECGVMPEIVSVWDGHVIPAEDKSVTAKVYTHLEQYEALHLSEIKKYDYEL